MVYSSGIDQGTSKRRRLEEKKGEGIQTQTREYRTTLDEIKKLATEVIKDIKSKITDLEEAGDYNQMNTIKKHKKHSNTLVQFAKICKDIT